MAAPLEDLVLRLEAVTSRLESLAQSTSISKTKKREISLEIAEKTAENSENPAAGVASEQGTKPFHRDLTSDCDVYSLKTIYRSSLFLLFGSCCARRQLLGLDFLFIFSLNFPLQWQVLLWQLSTR